MITIHNPLCGLFVKMLIVRFNWQVASFILPICLAQRDLIIEPY